MIAITFTQGQVYVLILAGAALVIAGVVLAVLAIRLMRSLSKEIERLRRAQHDVNRHFRKAKQTGDDDESGNRKW